MRIYLLGLILLAGLALAAPATDPCAVQVVIDLQTYDGLKHYENFCLSQPALYGNGLLSVEAVSNADLLFHGDFELWP